jgi:hypothetical protein
MAKTALPTGVPAMVSADLLLFQKTKILKEAGFHVMRQLK